MVPNTWQAMGCKGFKSERECNEHLGFEVLQGKYEKHWYARPFLPESIHFELIG